MKWLVKEITLQCLHYFFRKAKKLKIFLDTKTFLMKKNKNIDFKNGFLPTNYLPLCTVQIASFWPTLDWKVNFFMGPDMFQTRNAINWKAKVNIHWTARQRTFFDHCLHPHDFYQGKLNKKKFFMIDHIL